MVGFNKCSVLFVIEESAIISMPTLQMRRLTEGLSDLPKVVQPGFDPRQPVFRGHTLIHLCMTSLEGKSHKSRDAPWRPGEAVSRMTSMAEPGCGRGEGRGQRSKVI